LWTIGRQNRGFCAEIEIACRQGVTLDMSHAIPGLRTTRQHLIIDADDTLWHNNIYFEQAVDEFIDFLDHSSLTRSEVRAVLDEIESAAAMTGGYGSKSFAANLRACYERLAERHIEDADMTTVMQFGERILRQEIQPLDGVESTLSVLAERHDLILFTKGDHEEQRLKIDRSGVGGYFRRHVIVSEKDAPAYLRLLGDLASDPAHTWMVGNSPKSDINPALEAGLNAVFIPYEYTWALEHQELTSGSGQLLVLERFADLLNHF
jgi:putative hydrolase of the HAD superfamily